jgi:tetratricopeptide (TPR) repeat protein
MLNKKQMDRSFVIAPVALLVVGFFAFYLSYTAGRPLAGQSGTPSGSSRADATDSPDTVLLTVGGSVFDLLHQSTESILASEASVSEVRALAQLIAEDAGHARFVGGTACVRIVQILGRLREDTLVEAVLVAMEAVELETDHVREAYVSAARSAWQRNDDVVVAAQRYQHLIRLSEDRVPASLSPREIDVRLEALGWLERDAQRREDGDAAFALTEQMYELVKGTHSRAPTKMATFEGTSTSFARALAARGEPERAIEIMNAMMSECPDCGVEDGRRLTWIAERTQYLDVVPGSERYSEVYEEVVAHKDFVTSPYASAFANNLAISYRLQSRLDAAILTSRYVEVLANDAAESSARDAAQREEEKRRAARAAVDVAEMLETQNRLQESLAEFERVLREYPNSEHRAAVESRVLRLKNR